MEAENGSNGSGYRAGLAIAERIAECNGEDLEGSVSAKTYGLLIAN
jgi:hypothetical protein